MTDPIPPSTDAITLVELLFFAYRDFTADADVILAEYGLFRAHHRALHFVRRRPGLRIADLLAILKITKQSLGRVLTDLSAQGLIENRPDGDDRRARRIYITANGAALAERLAAKQVMLIQQALQTAAIAPGDGRRGGVEAAVRQFLSALIAPDERGRVAELLSDMASDT